MSKSNIGEINEHEKIKRDDRIIETIYQRDSYYSQICVGNTDINGTRSNIKKLSVDGSLNKNANKKLNRKKDTSGYYTNDKYPYCFKINNQYYPFLLYCSKPSFQPTEIILRYLIIAIDDLNKKMTILDLHTNEYASISMLDNYMSLYGMFFLGYSGDISVISKRVIDSHSRHDIINNTDMITKLIDYYKKMSTINIFNNAFIDNNQNYSHEYKLFIKRHRDIYSKSDYIKLENIYKLNYTDVSHPTIIAYILKTFLEDNPQTVFISLGMSGTGKTQLLKTLCRLVGAQDRKSVV